MRRIRCLSGNALKLIAALAMTVDHVGVILLPQVPILRIVGRLAFPIFAFMIAEGCRYTRNKLRYFALIFGTGSVCQLVLFLYNGSHEMNILLTFSLSVLLIYALQYFKEELLASRPCVPRLCASLVLLGAGLGGVVALASFLDLDYGAVGVMVPLYAAILHPPRRAAHTPLHRFRDPFWQVLTMSLGLLLLALDDGNIQWYALLCIPLLCLYSGKRGKYNLKYFFYVFYPLHLLLVQAIAWILL